MHNVHIEKIISYFNTLWVTIINYKTLTYCSCVRRCSHSSHKSHHTGDTSRHIHPKHTWTCSADTLYKHKYFPFPSSLPVSTQYHSDTAKNLHNRHTCFLAIVFTITVHGITVKFMTYYVHQPSILFTVDVHLSKHYPRVTSLHQSLITTSITWTRHRAWLVNLSNDSFGVWDSMTLKQQNRSSRSSVIAGRIGVIHCKFKNTLSDWDVVTASVCRMTSRRRTLGSFTLLQALSVGLAVYGRSSSATIDHCCRHKM